MEEKQNLITYDENWQSVSEPEVPLIRPLDDWGEEPQENLPPREKHPRQTPRQLVLTVQLVACILLALAAFALKSFGGEAYSFMRDWYYTNLNNTAVFDGSRGFDLKNLFSATADEA